MSATSIWQQLFDAVKFRLQEIRTANGYETEIGAHGFAWRDLGQSPFTTDELPGFTVRDTERDSTQFEVISAHDHRVTFEVVAVASAGDGQPDNFARSIASDIDRCIGTDRRWTVTGTQLARDTKPGVDRLSVSHQGDRIVAVTKTFTVEFRTRIFDPYQQ